jgi:lysozyme family protein
MSDFSTCYSWMLANEDAAHAYATVPDAPPGAEAISGINSVAFPSEFAAINAIPQAQRGSAVENFYETCFWNQWIAQVASNDVAKRVFDAMVNMGPSTACRLLQAAVNTRTQPQIATDGNWGPATVAAANACDPVALMGAFIAARVQHYRDIVAANPNDQQYLAAWLARTSK